MAQTPRARTQLANVPRTLQQVPTGAITRTTHSKLYGFPQSKRQQRRQNHKQTLRQDISRHHRTCHLLRKFRIRSSHLNEPTHATSSPGNTTKYPHATSAPKLYLPSNQLAESIEQRSSAHSTTYWISVPSLPRFHTHPCSLPETSPPLLTRTLPQPLINPTTRLPTNNKLNTNRKTTTSTNRTRGHK